MITQERLKEVLDYNLSTGAWEWKISRGSVKIGKAAGHKDLSHGYIKIKVDGKHYKAHRLAFLYVEGRYPTDREVDHKNMNRVDNRWSNLRLATPVQQRANRRVQSNNSLGVKGVSIFKRKPSHKVKYRAVVGKKTIGYFDTIAAARIAYVCAAVDLYGDFARY